MTLLETLFLELPNMTDHHIPNSQVYNLLKKLAGNEIEKLFLKDSKKSSPFGPFGEIVFPYFKMGAINSLDLFGMDELIIFSFYWKNRNRYKKVLDIGGNIGLHTILMSKCGYSIKVFEPDPVHYEKLIENITLNQSKNILPFQAAVSTKEGTAHFVRVLGNTTSSHIKGSKDPYGDLETFPVKLEDIKKQIQQIDLIKMDVEGHEKEILLALDQKDFSSMDMIVEIGSSENAQAVFDHLQKKQINAFSQKLGWQLVKTLEDMPTSHRDGSLFISTKEKMPWE